MSTLKKIILFLFGIVLIVFGNKAAINTLFKGDDGLKEADQSEKETDIKIPVITEEIETQEADVAGGNNITSASKEPVATATAKSTKEVKAKDSKSHDKKEDKKIKEATETKIEPVKEESAAASE